MIANLVQFQSWKGVIRYGAIHNANGRSGRLARLFGFTTALDAFAILAGSIIAIAGVPLVGPWLNWPAHEQFLAALFAVALLLSTSGTPSGILRLFDRFDLLASTEALIPVIRLAGALAAWAAGGGVVTFLIVWGASGLGQTLTQWCAAIAIHRTGFSFGWTGFRRALRENRRVLRFMILTNLSGSLSLFWMQLGTLSVGGVTGPAEAGGFRIAIRLSKGIAKPVEIVTRALYPELARLVAENNHAVVGRILIRGTTIAGLLGTLLVVAISFGGTWLISLIVGKDYAFAHVFLSLLAISAAFDITAFALEPLHIAYGRAGRLFRIRLVGAVIYVAMLLLLLPRVGSNGAAIASIAASAAMFIQLLLSARFILRTKSGLVAPAELA
jgi:O-antigen/teichoic acid export membrane protein